ncbi:MAG: hypothetical protein IJB97_06480 [Clostridia bacterium]|nr:hypothetical protein [Clostridia bacterium]
MNREKYILFLKETNHTEKSINSRLARLKKVEKIFQIDIDSIIYDKDKVKHLLQSLKEQNLDTTNQNLSNAVRKYYTCMTNDVLGKIF